MPGLLLSIVTFVHPAAGKSIWLGNVHYYRLPWLFVDGLWVFMYERPEEHPQVFNKEELAVILSDRDLETEEEKAISAVQAKISFRLF